MTKILGITRIQPISVSSLFEVQKNMINECRGLISSDFSMEDLAFVVFCSCIMKGNAYDHVCELLHGCRVLLVYLSPLPTIFSDFLQRICDLFHKVRE